VQVLVNNAGIKTEAVTLHEFTPDDFLSNFTTNAMGPFFVIQQLHKQGLLGHAPAAADNAADGAAQQPSPPQFPSPGGSLVVSISSVMGSQQDPTISSKLGGRYAYRWGVTLPLLSLSKVFVYRHRVEWLDVEDGSGHSACRGVAQLR
jgi:NAD(P)-dependent dehydrogenase (short-subunit alcohol dehydrogenase family)